MAVDATPIVSATELGNHLQRTLDPDTANQAIRIAEGELQDATQITPWPPSPVPEQLWTWAIQLAGFEYSNAEDLETKTVLAVSKGWSRRIDRKAQILAAAERRYALTGRPAGSFPPGRPWPDPVERYGAGYIPWLRAPVWFGAVPDDTAPAE